MAQIFLFLEATRLFKNNKFFYILASIGLIVIKLYVEVIELKGEREVEDIKII